MSAWLDRARVVVRDATADLSATATLSERRKVLRAAGPSFHGGTYWGRKQWGKAVRAYLERHGQAPLQPRNVEAAPNFGPDIIFPFRGIAQPVGEGRDA
jgi:hypothetical protein